MAHRWHSWLHAFVWVVCVVCAALFFKMAQPGGRIEKHFEQETENAIAGPAIRTFSSTAVEARDSVDGRADGVEIHGDEIGP